MKLETFFACLNEVKKGVLDIGGVIVTAEVPESDKAALDVHWWRLVFLCYFYISDVLKIDEGLLLRIVRKPFLRGQQVSLGGLFCLLFLLLQQLGGALLDRQWDRGCVNVGLPLPVWLQAGSLWWPCENTSSISLMISRHWSELGNICNHPV